MKSLKKVLHFIGSMFFMAGVALIPGFAVAMLLGTMAAFATTAVVTFLILRKILPEFRLLTQGSGSPVVIVPGLLFIGGALAIGFPDFVGIELVIVLPESPPPYMAPVSTLLTWFTAVMFFMGLGAVFHGLACLWDE